MATAEQAFNKSIERVEALVRLHSQLHGQPGRPQQHVSDILRSSLVLTMAALDAVVSSSVASVLPELIRCNGIAEAMQKWVKANPDAVVQSLMEEDPVRALAQMLEERLLLTSSYQRVEKIQQVLCDYADCHVDWGDVARRANEAKVGRKKNWTEGEVRRRLNAFVERRNAIAHQGDLKATGASTAPIQRDYVVEAIGLTKCTGAHVCAIIKARRKQLKIV